MGLMHEKGKVEKLVEGVDLSHLLKEAARSTLRAALDQPPSKGSSGDALEQVSGSGGVDIGKVAKPGLVVAGGVAGLTAASAAISALRRRQSP